MKKKVKDKLDNNSIDIDPYELDKMSKVPSWLIVLLLKYWAAAAAVFFIANGGTDLGFEWTNTDSTDVIAILVIDIRLSLMIGLVMALFINYIIRPIVRLMYNRRNNTYRYNMVNVKGFKSFLIAFPYMLFLSFLLCFVTKLLSEKGLVFDPFGTTGGVGIEPFTYALCFIIFDTLFIIIKNQIIKIYQRYKYNKQIKGE